jgi:hypothetical protein
MCSEDLRWIQLAQDRAQLWALVLPVLNFYRHVSCGPLGHIPLCVVQTHNRVIIALDLRGDTSGWLKRETEHCPRTPV